MFGIGCQRITREALVAAIDAGIELVDTAAAYGNEAMVGEVAREQVIVTKGGLGTDWVVDGRAKQLAESAQRSREALGRIDLYLLHAVDPKVPLTTSVRALAKLRDDGVVRGIGLSNVTLAQIEAACEVTAIDAVELEINVGKLDVYLVEQCVKRGIRVLAQRPFGGAAGVKKLLEDPLLRELGAPCEVVLAFLRGLSVTPLPGATRVETARSCARRVELSPEAMRALRERFLDERIGVARTGEVVMIMGMPGAGKSTLATRFEGYARLNRDELGGTLKGLAHKLDEVLATEPRVVLDNTYGSRTSRAQVVRIAKRHGVAVRCVVLDTPLEDCERNAAARIIERYGRLLSPAELVAEKQVAPNVLFRYRRQLEPPREDEGFTIEHVAFERAPVRGTHKAAILELDHAVWTGRPRKRVELAAHAREVIAAWQQRGYRIAATTWQPEPFDPSIDAQLFELLDMTFPIARCTHPPGPPICWCRKPLPGMALLLAHDHDFDLATSIHLGRTPADRGFAQRAGMHYADYVAGNVAT